MKSFNAEHRSSGLSQAISDSLVITWRNLKRIPRIPELAIFAILQSIMFVLLFAFVFGGAIPLPGGGSYSDFLMPASLRRPLPLQRPPRPSA
jgi:ABC-2 type transport system permease protein